MNKLLKYWFNLINFRFFVDGDGDGGQGGGGDDKPGDIGDGADDEGSGDEPKQGDEGDKSGDDAQSGDNQQGQNQGQKKKKSFDDRKAELARQTYEARQAQREAAEERRKLDEERRKLEEMKSSSIRKPNPDDYDDIKKYEADVDKYYKEMGAIETQKKIIEHQQQSNNDRQIRQSVDKWNYKKQQAAKKDPSILAHENAVVMAFRAFQTHPVVEQNIIDSDLSTELVSYLGQHPDALDRLAQSNPGNALKEIGRLEAKLSMKPEKPTQTPPPPPGSNDGAGSAQRDTTKESYAEYAKRRNKEMFGY